MACQGGGRGGDLFVGGLGVRERGLGVERALDQADATPGVGQRIDGSPEGRSHVRAEEDARTDLRRQREGADAERKLTLLGERIHADDPAVGVPQQADDSGVDAAEERRVGVGVELVESLDGLGDDRLLHEEPFAGEADAGVVGHDHDEAVARDERGCLSVVLLVDIGPLQEQRDGKRNSIRDRSIDVGGISDDRELEREHLDFVEERSAGLGRVSAGALVGTGLAGLRLATRTRRARIAGSGRRRRLVGRPFGRRRTGLGRRVRGRHAVGVVRGRTADRWNTSDDAKSNDTGDLRRFLIRHRFFQT